MPVPRDESIPLTPARQVDKDPIRLDEAFLWSFGALSVPINVWRAMGHYAPWLEPAVLNEWIEIMRGYESAPSCCTRHLIRQGVRVGSAAIAAARSPRHLLSLLDLGFVARRNSGSSDVHCAGIGCILPSSRAHGTQESCATRINLSPSFG